MRKLTTRIITKVSKKQFFPLYLRIHREEELHRYRPIICRSRVTSTGLRINISIPSSNIEGSEAETTKTGISLKIGSRALSRRNPRPSKTGIAISRIINIGSRAAFVRTSMACLPFSASKVEYPLVVRSSDIVVRISSSSSISITISWDDPWRLAIFQTSRVQRRRLGNCHAPTTLLARIFTTNAVDTAAYGWTALEEPFSEEM